MKKNYLVAYEIGHEGSRKCALNLMGILSVDSEFQ